MDTKPTQKRTPAVWLAEGRKKAIARGVVFGIKKGSKTTKTLKKERIQKSIDQIIMGKAEQIIKATLIPALGMNFVYRIDDEIDVKGRVISRKHILVTDPEEIAEALDQMEEGGTHPDEKYYYVTAKAPEYKAGESLLNRLLGKPKESLAVEVEHKFSLRDLGKKADELEKARAREITGSEVPPAENKTP